MKSLEMLESEEGQLNADLRLLWIGGPTWAVVRRSPSPHFSHWVFGG